LQGNEEISMAYPHDSTSERTSVLGPTLRFKGELTAAEDLLIHGQVEGTIGPSPRVTIGAEAVVKAMVTADVIVVEGKVEGDLKAQTSITVRQKGVVRGNIEAPVINIVEGASFNGNIKMDSGKSAVEQIARSPGAGRTGTAD
jgi:cytoskeletal protein CcmA (bactofilin family)